MLQLCTKTISGNWRRDRWKPQIVGASAGKCGRGEDGGGKIIFFIQDKLFDVALFNSQIIFIISEKYFKSGARVWSSQLACRQESLRSGPGDPPSGHYCLHLSRLFCQLFLHFVFTFVKISGGGAGAEARTGGAA